MASFRNSIRLDNLNKLNSQKNDKDDKIIDVNKESNEKVYEQLSMFGFSATEYTKNDQVETNQKNTQFNENIQSNRKSKNENDNTLISIPGSFGSFNKTSSFKEFIENKIPKENSDFIDIYKGFLNEGYIYDDVQIDINSNNWDFSKLTLFPRSNCDYIYKFTNGEHELVYLQKMFIINQITNRGIHKIVINRYNTEIELFIKYLNSNNIYDCSKIKLYHVKTFIEDRLMTVSYRAIDKLKNPIKKYLDFIDLSYKEVLTSDIRRYLDHIDTNKANRIAKKNKTKILPTEFIKNLNIIVKNAIDDPETPYREFINYAILYILIQTGIRRKEILVIPLDPIEKVKLHENKIMVWFHYNSTKNTEKGWLMTASPNNEEFANYMKKINKRIINENLIDMRKNFFFDKISKNGLSHRFLYNLCASHAKELKIINNSESWRFSNNKKIKELKTSKIKKCTLQKINENYNEEDIISFPSCMQFRKYWASDMKKRGYSDLEILRWLGHHDEKMLGYYGETEDSVIENIDFSKERLKDILENDETILGPRGRQYKEDFIKIAKENSKKSIDEVIDIILGQKQIRRKSGGFCCKANIGRPCSFDSQTDRFYCAYEMCPNQCHMYYDLPYYLNELNILNKTYQKNLDNNHKNAVEKELYKIKHLLRVKLIPELNELDNKLKTNTVEDIIEDHPEMDKIIRKRKEIRKELESWQKKIDLMNMQNN